MSELVELQFRLKGLLEMSTNLTDTAESRSWVSGYRFGLQQALNCVTEQIAEWDSFDPYEYADDEMIELQA